MPRILVIIVNWNKKQFLENLLTQLEEQRPPDFSVAVVDNASTDGSQEMVKTKFPKVTLIENETNLGGTGGFNTGLRYGLETGGFDYFWLLDNDVVLHEGALQALLEEAEKDTSIAIVGPKLLDLDNPDYVQEIGVKFDWKDGSLLQIDAGKNRDDYRCYDVDYVASCCLLARVETIRKIGLWDPVYFVTWDDMDWCYRFKRAGYRVIATSKAIVEHASFEGRRFSSPLVKFYYWSRNELYFFSKFTQGFQRIRVPLSRLRWMLDAIAQYRVAGDRVSAFYITHAMTDFFRGKMGAAKTMTPPPSSPDLALRVERLKKKKGKLIFVPPPNRELTHTFLTYIRKHFTDFDVDVFVPYKYVSLREVEIPNAIRVPFLSLFSRLKFLRRISRAYDAVIEVETSFKFFFQYCIPQRIVLEEDGSHQVFYNSPVDIVRFMTAKFRVLLALPFYAIRFWLKPRKTVAHEGESHQEA